jgi:putative acetyltransferase
VSEPRLERAGDVAAIRAVLAACFPTPAEARLVDALRDARHLAVSLVVEADGEVVGHVAFSPVRAASGAVGAGLAPLAVRPAYRRRGLGARLVERGLAACAARGFGWAVVLGGPDYYARFGFTPAPEAGLSDEYGGGAAFQVLELAPGMLPRDGGLVTYAPEFADLAAEG